MCIKNRAIHYEAESCPQACTCLRLHMCICAPERTLSLISRHSYRCCSLSYLPTVPLCSATPPGLPSSHSCPAISWDRCLSCTDRVLKVKDPTKPQIFLFLPETQILLGRRSPPVCGRSESICIYARTHISQNKNLWKFFFILFAFDVEQHNLVLYKQIFH